MEKEIIVSEFYSVKNKDSSKVYDIKLFKAGNRLECVAYLDNKVVTDLLMSTSHDIIDENFKIWFDKDSEISKMLISVMKDNLNRGFNMRRK